MAYNKAKIKFKKHTFSVELADTFFKRAKGLMGRKYLSSNAGMLFSFPYSARYSFWMFLTRIALDIIWLDENYKVVHIEENAKPWSCRPLRPSKKAKYVLELNAGTCERVGLSVNCTFRNL